MLSPLKSRLPRFCWPILVLLWLVLCSAVPGDDVARTSANWPQWRGSLASGVAPGGDPPIEFSETKNIRWKYLYCIVGE